MYQKVRNNSSSKLKQEVVNQSECGTQGGSGDRCTKHARRLTSGGAP